MPSESDNFYLIIIMSVASEDVEHVNSIKLEVCSDLYDRWKAEKSWFHNVPRKGIQTQVNYVDTRPESGNDLPIILCLHGAPGSHSDFSLLRERLRDYPVRIVCPNWPSKSKYPSLSIRTFLSSSPECFLLSFPFMKLVLILSISFIF